MTFVVLYGPPAVGKLTVATELAKLTVATELAKLTGFRVFHNHFSVDLAEEIFTRSSPSFGRTVRALDQVVFQEAAQAEVDLFTSAYAYSQDDPEMRWMLGIFKACGARTLLVQLTCDQSTLKARLGEASRRAYGKVKDVKMLEYLLETYDLFTPYPERPSLHLDTTTTPPQETAATIATHLSRY